MNMLLLEIQQIMYCHVISIKISIVLLDLLCASLHEAQIRPVMRPFGNPPPLLRLISPPPPPPREVLEWLHSPPPPPRPK